MSSKKPIKNFTSRYSFSREHKILMSLVMDAFLISSSFFLAFWTRMGEVIFTISHQFLLTLFCVIAITLIVFTKLGIYRAVLRHLTSHALMKILIGTSISALSIPLFSYYSGAEVPRTVPIIYLAFLTLSCGGMRMGVRFLISKKNNQFSANVLVYGAGTTGRQLNMALRSSGKYKVKGFIDDDPSLKKTIIQGLRVFPAKKFKELVEKHQIEIILLAIPRASRSQRKKIIDSLLHLPIKVLTIPDFNSIVEGKANVDELKEVSNEDLLGREPIVPNSELMRANIYGKVVMVTGAGGSIGSELSRQIINQSPKTLVLLELSESCLYQIHKELSDSIKTKAIMIEVIPILASVQHLERLNIIMQSFQIQTVYHAAAYKHVPLVEYNVLEGIRNNVFGTYYTAKAAIDAGVNSFVLISTDKAVRPTNIMGASKRISELILQAFSEQEYAKSHHTRFSMVRFGNVLESSGSVIPLFKSQITEGGVVTVTDPDIIRYFMTIPEASQLVIQASAMSTGGDVFVLDMGKPVRILDLAYKLIRLSGLEVKSKENPNGDVEIKFTGLRPGEKLFEELLISKEVQKTQHPRIMTAKEKFILFSELQNTLEKLDNACVNSDYETIQQILLEIPIEFNSKKEIHDLTWKAQNELNLQKNKIVQLKKKK
jgi:FlaA1/EpsC-like NDP-sugar epimerase